MSAGPVRRTAAAPAARSHLRLTRRGRLVLVAAAAAPLVAAAVWFGVSSGSAAAGGVSAGAPASIEHVTVRPGESLWQIAETVAPHDDPREVIDAIVDMNGLQSSVVTPGESLAIPPQYAK
ncbi:LysM peptidoglycan-binding domain-containing protein [Gryllotalpicola koreensis]|uniref:LysM peptidoglycan-binding domain-containing protein n=1 Tax=Gryllotalpicola koreensis TaxID=993086 RepID=UPI0031D3B859